MKLIALIHNTGPTSHQEEVLGRAEMWADRIVVVESLALDAASRLDAWSELVSQAWPTTGDVIVLLNNDEVLVEHERIRQACDRWPGYRLKLMVVTMWSHRHYRTDPPWEPFEEARIFPFQREVHFDGSLPLPTYAYQVPLRQPEVGTVLSYQFAEDADKSWWRTHWQKTGVNSHESETILTVPTTEEWDRGGLLHV